MPTQDEGQSNSSSKILTGRRSPLMAIAAINALMPNDSPAVREHIENDPILKIFLGSDGAQGKDDNASEN